MTILDDISTTAEASPVASHPLLPIRIRDNLVVRVGNLPLDLTLSEARHIKKVLDAHVLETTPAMTSRDA